MDAKGSIGGIVEQDEATGFEEGVTVLKIELGAVIAVISVHVAEADAASKGDRATQDIVNRPFIAPESEKFVRECFDGERQVVGAERLYVAKVGFLDETFVVGEENRRSANVAAIVVVILKFPFIAGKKR